MDNRDAVAGVSANDLRANDLHYYAIGHPQGFTRYDIQRDLGWDNVLFVTVVRVLRLRQAEDDATLICNPQGQHEPYLYKLVSAPKDAQVWAKQRVKDCDTRLRTQACVIRTVANATDKRTRVGRKAHLMADTLEYLQRQLEDVEIDFANGSR